MQFVAMQDVQFQPPEKIAQTLLEEIPGQVTSYMQAYSITPSTLHAQ